MHRVEKRRLRLLEERRAILLLAPARIDRKRPEILQEHRACSSKAYPYIAKAISGVWEFKYFSDGYGW